MRAATLVRATASSEVTSSPTTRLPATSSDANLILHWKRRDAAYSPKQHLKFLQVDECYNVAVIHHPCAMYAFCQQYMMRNVRNLCFVAFFLLTISQCFPLNFLCISLHLSRKWTQFNRVVTRAYFNMLTGGANAPAVSRVDPPPRQSATFAHYYLPPFPSPPPAQQDLCYLLLCAFDIFSLCFPRL